MDMRKLLNTLTETTAGATAAGSVASVAQPMETQRRVEEDKPEKPEVIEYGNWENSALTTAEGVKSVRKKSAKVVKSIYGEDAPSANKKTKVAESTRDLNTQLAAFIKQQKDKKATATNGSQSAPRKSSDPNSPPWLLPGEKIISDYYTNLRRRPDVDSDDHPYYEDKTHGLMEGDNHWQIVKIDKRADGSYAVHIKDTRDDQVKVKVGSKKYLEGLLKKQYGITKELSEGISEDTLDESDLIINPAGMAKLSRGLVSKDHDRTDHEVEMARSDLYQTSKNALQIFKLIQGLSEEEGLEGWVQEKIIKAADYLTTVREYLEGKHVTGEGLGGALAGGIVGAVATKTPGGAIAGANIGSELQDKLGESLDGVGASTKMFTSETSSEKAAKYKEKAAADVKALKKHVKGEYGDIAKGVIAKRQKGIERAEKRIEDVSEGEKPGLWDNIRAKRERIKAGSGERMRKPGSKGAPSDKDLKSIRAASANEGVAEGKDSGYREIEFICVNPKFPNATDPELQKQMFQQLKNIPGVIPLFQGWDDYSQGQMSLSAIYKDRAVRGQILGLAKRLGVKVDLEQSVSDEYVDRAIRGEHEGQQGVAEGENIGGKRYDKIADLKGRTVDQLNKLIQKLEGTVAKYPDHTQTSEYLSLAKMIRAEKIGKKGVAEGVPQPGPSSGAPKQFGPDAKIQTRQMTVKDIISSIPDVPYYNNVVDDWDAKDYSWGVTKKVIEYATYLKDHPESLAKLPPAIVLNGKFEDGAHRVSAIWLLQQRMDPKNPLWKNAKLNVQFVKQGVAEGRRG